MTRTWRDVIEGDATWSCEQADALSFLLRLPDDSVDLLFTSPPYELARTYGIGEKMVGGQAWVDWMVELVAIAGPKVKGLIAINCEGQTRNYSYSGVPFLLFADLKRAGFNMRKPCVYERDGIPGSGGPDWLKNRWEPIICVTRPGRLPWSDTTACGKPPKHLPGGNPSHRTKNGMRASQRHRMKELVGTGVSQRKAAREVGYPMHGSPSGVDDEGVVVIPTYIPPDIANPGNVIDCGANTNFGFGNNSEAPFPLELPAFFVKSFCPPNGKVLDCFSGSGTTCQAAIENGRRFIGCDIRQSQVDLCSRRMATVTPPLPGVLA